MKLFIFTSIISLLAVSCGERIDSTTSDTTFEQALTAEGNACNASDKQKHIYPANYGFSRKWRSCASDTWGDGPQTTQCLVRAYPTLSNNCASCFGAMTACSKANCMWDCALDSNSPGCKQCAIKNCMSGLVSCTGVPQNQLPQDK